MRLIYIIGLLTVIGTGALWCGWYGMVRRRIAAMLAAVSILAGGVLLLLAVLPDYSFYGTTVTHNFAAGKNVALTFDDGPNPVSTPMILDTLEKYKVHATFFDLGNLVVRYPDVVKREALNGEVGTHTYSHKNLNTLSVDAINQELKLSREASKKVLGTEPILLRPPYGNANATVKALANMPIINWDVDSLDWKYRNKDLTLNEIYKYGNLDGRIILMHSIYTSTAEAVAILVPDLLDKGYQIVSVSEMATYRGYTLQTGTIYHNFR